MIIAFAVLAQAGADPQLGTRPIPAAEPLVAD
jgi:hypothetical protein